MPGLCRSQRLRGGCFSPVTQPREAARLVPVPEVMQRDDPSPVGLLAKSPGQLLPAVAGLRLGSLHAGIEIRPLQIRVDQLQQLDTWPERGLRAPPPGVPAPSPVHGPDDEEQRHARPAAGREHPQLQFGRLTFRLNRRDAPSQYPPPHGDRQCTRLRRGPGDRANSVTGKRGTAAPQAPREQTREYHHTLLAG